MRHVSAGDDALLAMCSLLEPQRKALYDVVIRHPGGIGRDDAARELRIDRSLAAYHLDRLVDSGVLDVEYRRLSGRTGPGAGRPAKIYRRSRREFVSAIPPRDYELAARLLAAVLETHLADGRLVDARPAVSPIATRIVGQVGPQQPPDVAEGGASARLASVLVATGYEPYDDSDGTVRLRNCPFHALTDDHRDLVCRLNHALLDRVADAAGVRADVAFEPTEDGCCVEIRPRRRPGRGTGARQVRTVPNGRSS